MKKLEEVLASAFGTTAALLVRAPLYDDWVQPMILAAICAMVGYGVARLCKWVFERK